MTPFTNSYYNAQLEMLRVLQNSTLGRIKAHGRLLKSLTLHVHSHFRGRISIPSSSSYLAQFILREIRAKS